jgi:hypothetical protein
MQSLQRFPSALERSIRLPLRQPFVPPFIDPPYTIVLDEWLLAIVRRSYEWNSLSAGFLSPANVNANDALCEVTLEWKVLCVESFACLLLTGGMVEGYPSVQCQGIYVVFLC